MKQTLQGLYTFLLEHYGSQGWWPINAVYKKRISLTNEEKFEIIVGAILTQNTAWSNVEKALENLRKNKCLSQKSILQTKQESIAHAIKSAGYFNQKAERLKIIAAFLLHGNSAKAQHFSAGMKPLVSMFDNPDGKANAFRHGIRRLGLSLQHRLEELQAMETGELRKLLLSVKGIGPETADSIILYAFNKPSFVIDAYTKRILSRMGFCRKDISYEELQRFCENNLDKDAEIYNEFHALLVEHAKRYCRTKPLCDDCILNAICKKNT